MDIQRTFNDNINEHATSKVAFSIAPFFAQAPKLPKLLVYFIILNSIIKTGLMQSYQWQLRLTAECANAI